MRFLPIIVFLGLLPSLPTFAVEPAKPIRVGIIGLDNYHSLAFTQLFHDAKEPKQPKTEGDLSGLHVVAAFPGGSPDIAESVDGLPKWKEQIARYGVTPVESIDALLAKVDAVLVTSLDGRVH